MVAACKAGQNLNRRTSKRPELRPVVYFEDHLSGWSAFTVTCRSCKVT